MTVRITKPEFNIREKLSELDIPVGNHGTQLMKSSDVAETHNLLQLKNLIQTLVLGKKKNFLKIFINFFYKNLTKQLFTKINLNSPQSLFLVCQDLDQHF